MSTVPSGITVLNIRVWPSTEMLVSGVSPAFWLEIIPVYDPAEPVMVNRPEVWEPSGSVAVYSKVPTGLSADVRATDVVGGGAGGWAAGGSTGAGVAAGGLVAQAMDSAASRVIEQRAIMMVTSLG